MAQFETTGGGVSQSGNQRTERKVVVSTSGNPTAPGGSGQLTNVNITKEPAGIVRGVFEYTTIRADLSAGGFNNGKRVELIGGSREVPIYNHPTFASLTEAQILSVQKAVDEKQEKSFTNATQQKLYSFLSRGTEYVLAPSVVARVTEIQSGLPSLNPIAKVANPSEVDAPTGTFWICTAVTASPVGDRYEVTREYTLNFSGWDEVEALYGW